MKPVKFVHFLTQVLRLQISRAWRVLLRIAIDREDPEALDDEDRELARQLFGAIAEIPESARRTLVWRLGRASGKTTIAAALGIWVMLTAPLAAVGPGMTPAVVTLAPSKPTAKISVSVARALVRRVQSLERLVCDEGDTSEGFTMQRPDSRRVAFVCVAASRGGTTLRGFDLLMLILDESEFLSSNSEGAAGDGYAVNDRDLYNAAKPRLHGPAVFISTPWPVENLTADLFDKNHGRPTTALAAIGCSTLMRPEDERLARDVAEAMQTDEENAAREYFCQPGVRGGSRLFDPASIDAAIVEGRPLVIQAPEGAAIGCGGDLGLERDSSAIAAVSNLDGDYELLEFDEIRPSKEAPLAPGYVVRQRFAPIAHRHRARGVMLDGHYRQSAVEHLEAEELEFLRAPEGNAGKYDTYMHLRALLREGKIRIPAVPRLVAQLRAVTQTPMPGGLVRISSPRRMGQAHGDVVSALVLAAWDAREAASGGGWFSLRPEQQRAALASVGAELGLGFDPSNLYERTPKPKPALVHTTEYATAEHRIAGQPPRFSPRETCTFRTGEESLFSEYASPDFKRACGIYRSEHGLT